MTNLRDTLHRFGHADFRPHQLEACESVTGGEDVLLVMPTGSGKSICYQVPALARGGNALVVSPLIALMEDQVAALQRVGVRAARIHSGRTREESRQACLDWVEGNLDFLYIAPERLRVPGFVEWLARRKPGLIAIDEAHCISHWGHDFRPDYRLIGARLPALRPCPIIALTATATPRVQRDIVERLGMVGARRLVHGFRRENLAVEAAPTRQGERHDIVRGLLADGTRLPAIVYVPSRKECDKLAEELAATVPCMPYHAGLSPADRDRAQRAFQAGDVSVIVATVAFGMGIDKHDIRTVIHTALPQSVEGYYQEIGRAGRDGKPSRAILLYGWNDRRLHEYFIERDYPPVPDMRRTWRALGDRPQSVADLCAELDLDEFAVEARLDKLLAHEAITVDADGMVLRGRDGWEPAYSERVEHRRAQLEDIFAFADGRSCRMTALVRHFGDREDHGRPCGVCDNCAPDDCLVRTHREPSPAERAAVASVLSDLHQRDGQTPGKLHAASQEHRKCDRREFEELLGAMEQAGMLERRADQFEKDGKTIAFQRVYLTDLGRKPGIHVSDALRMPGSTEAPAPKKPKKPRAPAPAATPDTDPALVAQLKDWRKRQAATDGVSAFYVLSNRTLDALAAARPRTRDELAAVPGIGPAKIQKYGESILGIFSR